MMTLSGVNSSNVLTSNLLSQGLTADKAQRVNEELTQSVKDSTNLLGQVDGDAARAKLDEAIAADVASGDLTEEDAAAINRVLDEADQASGNGEGSSGATASGGTGKAGTGKAGGGGGGGNGSEEKTELSRAVTVAGGIKTTIITYTDGTSDTETGPANGAPDTDKTATTTNDSRAKNWLSRVEPGTLVDRLA